MKKTKGEVTLVQAVWTVLGAVAMVSLGTWQVHEYADDTYASKEKLELAEGQLNLLMDARLESLIKQRDDIQRKPVKSAQDLRDLEYLDKQIEYLRKVQRAKTK